MDFEKKVEKSDFQKKNFRGSKFQFSKKSFVKNHDYNTVCTGWNFRF